MRKTFAVLAVAFALMETGGTKLGAALQFNPICFSTSPFGDILVWNLNTDGGSRLIGAGRDLAGDRSQTVAAFISGGTLNVGYTTYPQSGFVPVIAGGTIDIASETGPGQCFAPDFASCGSFTFARVDCPAGAAPLLTGGLAQGGQIK